VPTPAQVSGLNAAQLGIDAAQGRAAPAPTPHFLPRIRAVADAIIMTFIARVVTTGTTSRIPGVGNDKTLLSTGFHKYANVSVSASARPVTAAIMWPSANSAGITLPRLESPAIRGDIGISRALCRP
jgi:hypothetical protein